MAEFKTGLQFNSIILTLLTEICTHMNVNTPEISLPDVSIAAY